MYMIQLALIGEERNTVTTSNLGLPTPQSDMQKRRNHGTDMTSSARKI